MKSLKKNMHVRIRKVVHGSPKLPVKFTEGMTGKIVGFKRLIRVRLDKYPKLRYFYLPEELEMKSKKRK
jgi:hypothetical protein